MSVSKVHQSHHLTIFVAFLVSFVMLLNGNGLAQQMRDAPRFSEKTIILENGIVGRGVQFESANPPSFAAVITGKPEFPKIKIDGQLFMPKDKKPGKIPVVILAPGSLSVGKNLLDHANSLTSIGMAVLVFEPFGGRGISDTVADQSKLSWAASSYDVLAAVKFLANLPDINPEKIGAQGHSRGGTAVLLAAMSQMSQAVLDRDISLAAVLAAYPWCGNQFAIPKLGRTELRILMGDRDNWVSPIQCQACVQALVARDEKASMRLYPGAYHSFDRANEPPKEFPEAITALNLPIIYMNDEGILIDYRTEKADPNLADGDILKYAFTQGLIKRGAVMGTQANQAEEFKKDMLSFFSTRLNP